MKMSSDFCSSLDHTLITPQWRVIDLSMVFSEDWVDDIKTSGNRKGNSVIQSLTRANFKLSWTTTRSTKLARLFIAKELHWIPLCPPWHFLHLSTLHNHKLVSALSLTVHNHSRHMQNNCRHIMQKKTVHLVQMANIHLSIDNLKYK